MSHEHLRRAESAAISPDDRTRLEGKVELLEDGVALLASARAALEREVQSLDDPGTLRELARTWPELERALAAVDALPDGSGGELSALVRHEREAVRAALARRVSGTLRFEVSLVRAAEDIVESRTPPGPAETRFRQSRVAAEVSALFGGLAIGAYVLAMLAFSDDAGRHPSSWVVGLLIIVATLVSARGRSPWSLHADGFFARGRRWPWSEVTLGSGRRSTLASARFGDVEVEGDDVVRLVRLLQSPTLRGLSRTPVGAWRRQGGHYSIEGEQAALTIPSGEIDRVCLALGAREPVSAEDLCTVLAHLPEERLREVGQQLAEQDLAAWRDAPPLPAGRGSG
ncbi:MAG: hypothetical protein U0228_06430 [Myxococcaceae bacterium]